jgi:hypothetical protein
VSGHDPIAHLLESSQSTGLEGAAARMCGVEVEVRGAHRLAGTTVDDNMADPDHIAEVYLQLHRQHRSTWAFEIALRPWVEKW